MHKNNTLRGVDSSHNNTKNKHTRAYKKSSTSIRSQKINKNYGKWDVSKNHSVL